LDVPHLSSEGSGDPKLSRDEGEGGSEDGDAELHGDATIERSISCRKKRRPAVFRISQLLTLDTIAKNREELAKMDEGPAASWYCFYVGLYALEIDEVHSWDRYSEKSLSAYHMR
jgi:hypothetical protein